MCSWSEHINKANKLPNKKHTNKKQSHQKKKRSITFPVVCPYRPNISRNLSSLMASGLSILLPRIRIGTLAIVSSVISDYKGKEKGGEINLEYKGSKCYYSCPGGSKALLDTGNLSLLISLKLKLKLSKTYLNLHQVLLLIQAIFHDLHSRPRTQCH